MIKILQKVHKDLWYRLSGRLVQWFALKDKSEALMEERLTKDDFKWKQELKYYFEGEDIVVAQFDKKLVHQLEYYPP